MRHRAKGQPLGRGKRKTKEQKADVPPPQRFSLCTLFPKPFSFVGFLFSVKRKSNLSFFAVFNHKPPKTKSEERVRGRERECRGKNEGKGRYSLLCQFYFSLSPWLSLCLMVHIPFVRHIFLIKTAFTPFRTGLYRCRCST